MSKVMLVLLSNVQAPLGWVTRAVDLNPFFSAWILYSGLTRVCLSM